MRLSWRAPLVLLVLAAPAAAQVEWTMEWRGEAPMESAKADWHGLTACRSLRHEPDDHVVAAASSVWFEETAVEQACATVEVPLPRAQHKGTVELDARLTDEGTAVKVEMVLALVVGGQSTGAVVAQGPWEGRVTARVAPGDTVALHATFRDATPDGSGAGRTRLDVLDLRYRAADLGQPVPVERAESWLGAHLVAEQEWTIEVPEGPARMAGTVHLVVPQHYSVRSVEGARGTQWHTESRLDVATESVRIAVTVPEEAQLPAGLSVRTLSTRLPGNEASFTGLFAFAVVSVAGSGLAALRGAVRLHRQGGEARGGADALLWAGIGILVVVDILVLLRVVHPATWPLMVTPPLHPVALLLYAAFFTLILGGIGLALVASRRQAALSMARYRQKAREAYELKHLNAELDRFAAGLAHDMRGPLAGSRAALQTLAEREGAALSPDGRALMESVTRSLGSLHRLANDLLEFCQIEETDHAARVDVQAVVAEALQILQGAIAQRDAKVEVGLLPPVRGDRQQLLRLFQNLIENALKHHGPASPRIHVHAVWGDAEHTVVVEDDGPGMSDRSRSDAASADDGPQDRGAASARGLGLAMVERVASLHGGHVTVHTEPGRGTIFQVTLPAAEP